MQDTLNHISFTHCLGYMTSLILLSSFSARFDPDPLETMLNDLTSKSRYMRTLCTYYAAFFFL
jgi:hypothetical protein